MGLCRRIRSTIQRASHRKQLCVCVCALHITYSHRNHDERELKIHLRNAAFAQQHDFNGVGSCIRRPRALLHPNGMPKRNKTNTKLKADKSSTNDDVWALLVPSMARVPKCQSVRREAAVIEFEITNNEFWQCTRPQPQRHYRMKIIRK